MSVILDALKKLDREKSSRRNGTVNIAVEILRPDLPHPGKRTRLYFATIALTIVATLAITYAVMVEFRFLSKSSPPASVSSPVPNQQFAPPSPEVSSMSKSLPPEPMRPTVPSQQVAPAPLSREPVRNTGDEISQRTPKIQTPVEIKTPTETKPSSTSLEGKKASQNVIPEKTEVAPEITKITVEPIPNGIATTPPSIKISAIVWYQDPSMRFAMINGIKATEGSVVEGVKIVEINPTSVRFLHNGQYFEISLAK
jgi:general secretion pathway protein B